MGAETVDGVGKALSILVERLGGRIEGGFSAEDVAALVERKLGEVNIFAKRFLRELELVFENMELSSMADSAKAQDFFPQLLARKMGGVATDECLTRRGSLSAVGRDVGVSRKKVEALHRHTEGFGADLCDHGEGALADVDRAHVNGDAAVALQADAHGGGIGERSVAAAIPHARDADSTAQCGSILLIECRGFVVRLIPARTQSFEARAHADASAKHLAGDGWILVFERIQDTEFQFVHGKFFGKHVVELFLRDGALGHSEAAERACGNEMRVYGASLRAIVRDFVWPGAMNGHASSDGGTPGSIGTGIEFPLKIHGQQSSIGGGAGAAMDFRRMALCGAANGFRTGINHFHWFAKMPGGNGEKRVRGKIQLRAKGAANG